MHCTSILDDYLLEINRTFMRKISHIKFNHILIIVLEAITTKHTQEISSFHRAFHCDMNGPLLQTHRNFAAFINDRKRTSNDFVDFYEW